MSLRDFINKQRLNAVLELLQVQYPDMSKGQLLGALDLMFFQMFFSDAFGSNMMMITAGHRFIRMVEEQLGKAAAGV